MPRIDYTEKEVSFRTFISLLFVFISLLFSLISFFSSFTSYNLLFIFLQWTTALAGLILAVLTLAPARKYLDHNPFLLQTLSITIVLGCVDVIWISIVTSILSILG
jgi:hypothetical protein